MCRPKAKTMTILRRAIEEYELTIAAGMPDDYTQEYDIKTTEPIEYAAASTNTTLKCRNTTTA